ncbi:hypothetical protein CS542_01595 [Pedobacter sp. IW39]|nr:hypothetical protein CS542_01595 [Pedobacter sp. IW39]
MRYILPDHKQSAKIKVILSMCPLQAHIKRNRQNKSLKLPGKYRFTSMDLEVKISFHIQGQYRGISMRLRFSTITSSSSLKDNVPVNKICLAQVKF